MMDDFDSILNEFEVARNEFISKRDECQIRLEEYKKLRQNGVLKDGTSELFEARKILNSHFDDLENKKDKYYSLHREIGLKVLGSNPLTFIKKLV